MKGMNEDEFDWCIDKLFMGFEDGAVKYDFR